MTHDAVATGDRHHPPTFHMRGMWSVAEEIARIPRARGSDTEERLCLIEDELAVRDMFATYANALDAGDLDAVMRYFHDDCVLVNRRGTYVGRNAIRRNYAYLISRTAIALHFIANVAVRFLDGGREAWSTAYTYSLASTESGQLRAVAGTNADRLVRVNDAWLIRERRITANLAHLMDGVPFDLGGTAPDATEPQTSYDLIGRAAYR